MQYMGCNLGPEVYILFFLLLALRLLQPEFLLLRFCFYNCMQD